MRLTASVAPVDNYDAGVAAVLQGRTDVLFGDRAQLLQAVQRSPDAKDLRVLSRHFTFAALALALPRNDDDFRLAVDRALTQRVRTRSSASCTRRPSVRRMRNRRVLQGDVLPK